MGEKIVIAEPVPHNRVTAEDVQLFENFSQEALQNLNMLCTEQNEPHSVLDTHPNLLHTTQELRLTNEEVFSQEIYNILNSQLVIIRQSNHTKFEICAGACIIILVFFVLVFGLYIHR